MRAARSEVTVFTPFFVNFGREHVICGKHYQAENVEKEADKEQDDNEMRGGQEGYQQMVRTVVERLAKTYQRNERAYKLRSRHVTYEVNQKLWRKNKSLSDASKYYTSKLAPHYLGPFWIKRMIRSTTYELMDRDGKPCGIWHVQDLKPFLADDL